MSKYKFYDSDGNERSIYWMVRNEQSWAESRLLAGREDLEKVKNQQWRIEELEACLRLIRKNSASDPSLPEFNVHLVIDTFLNVPKSPKEDLNNDEQTLSNGN